MAGQSKVQNRGFGKKANPHCRYVPDVEASFILVLAIIPLPASYEGRHYMIRPRGAFSLWRHVFCGRGFCPTFFQVSRENIRDMSMPGKNVLPFLHVADKTVTVKIFDIYLRDKLTHFTSPCIHIQHIFVSLTTVVPPTGKVLCSCACVGGRTVLPSTSLKRCARRYRALL